MSRPGLADVLRRPDCDGAGTLHLVARKPFWDEDDLPFHLEGGGQVFRVVAQKGFKRTLLAASDDERRVIVDCPDAAGWLVPEGVIAGWMARHVSVPELDDLLLSHPLYEYLTHPDEQGRSRGGRGRLVGWTPGVATMATVAAPEFLPDDEDAPDVNRVRADYADAVVDLVRRLERAFSLAEIEVGIRLVSPRRGRAKAR
jgi:hypothetical protein